MDGEDFAGVELSDRDPAVVGEREDPFAGMCDAGVEVVHPAGAAQGHLAADVEPVVAQAVVAGGVAVARRERFRGCAVSIARGPAPERPVRAALVVVLAELVELALQLAERSRGRPRSQPALQRLVKALDLALGLGMSRRDPFFCWTPSSGSRYSNALRPPPKRAVKTRPLSVSVEAGAPWASTAARNVETTSSPVTGACTLHDNRCEE